jgi:hypothetical protein
LPNGSTRCASGALQVEVKVVVPQALRDSAAPQIIARNICAKGFSANPMWRDTDPSRREDRLGTVTSDNVAVG